MITLILLNENNLKNIPSETQFQHWINATTNTVSEKISETCRDICISIIDKKTSAELNETYRHKQGPTNVLSFPYSAIPGVTQESLGDLAICAPLVEEESQSSDAIAHWAHLTVHGILHLCGYDHIIDADAEVMESLEIQILQQLQFKDPYQ